MRHTSTAKNYVEQMKQRSFFLLSRSKFTYRPECDTHSNRHKNEKWISMQQQ